MFISFFLAVYIFELSNQNGMGVEKPGSFMVLSILSELDFFSKKVRQSLN